MTPVSCSALCVCSHSSPPPVRRARSGGEGANAPALFVSEAQSPSHASTRSGIGGDPFRRPHRPGRLPSPEIAKAKALTSSAVSSKRSKNSAMAGDRSAKRGRPGDLHVLERILRGGL